MAYQSIHTSLDIMVEFLLLILHVVRIESNEEIGICLFLTYFKVKNKFLCATLLFTGCYFIIYSFFTVNPCTFFANVTPDSIKE